MMELKIGPGRKACRFLLLEQQDLAYDAQADLQQRKEESQHPGHTRLQESLLGQLTGPDLIFHWRTCFVVCLHHVMSGLP